MKKSIRTPFSRYYLAATTKDFIFYADYNESDENAQILMYDSKMKLISNNYFAFVGLMDEIEENKFTWLSRTMKKNINLMQEQNS